MTRNWILHTKDGNKVITEAEAIQNAAEQEAAGIRPVFAWYDHRTGEHVTPPGWLVWSTYQDGAGVVYKRETDGKPVVVTGWQADFVAV